MLLFAPGLDFNVAVFACMYAGAIAVPAYPPDPLRLQRTLPRLEAMVRDAQAIGDALAMVESWLVADMGWQLIGMAPSPIDGQDGNREFLLAGRKP